MKISILLTCLVLVSSVALAKTATLTTASGLVVKEGGQNVNYQLTELSELPQLSLGTEYKKPLPQTHLTARADRSGNLKLTTLSKVWGLYTYGTGIGSTGFYSADIDEDSNIELVFSSGVGFGANFNISIMDYSDGNYIISEQFSIPGNNSVRSIVGGYDSTSDNHLLFVSDSAGGLHIYNLSARTWIDTNFTSVSAHVLQLFDVNNDGQVELVTIGQDETNIIDISSKEIISTYSQGGDNGIVGHFTDADTAVIVYSSGQAFTVTDSGLEQIWDRGEAFGSFFTASDVNKDGVEELIAAKGWYEINAFDVNSKALLWTHTTDLDIDALYSFDVNGDGVKEVLYGDGQWGSIYALSPTTGVKLWEVNNPEHGVTQIHIADLDADGKLELIWGAGYSSTGADYLYIHDLDTRVFEWRSKDISGPFYGYEMADVDNDGVSEIVAVSYESESGYSDGVVFVFDSLTFELKWSTAESKPFHGHAWTGVHDLSVGDVNGDGNTDIVVVTDNLYDGALYVLEGKSGALQYEKVFDSGSPLYAVKLADLEGDGDIEIVAAGGKEHTGASGRFIYVINGNDGSLKQKSPTLGSNWDDIRQLEILDFNQDGSLDAVAVVDGKVFVYDIVSNSLRQTVSASLMDATSSILAESSALLTIDSSGWLYHVENDMSLTTVARICDSNGAGLSTISHSRLGFRCGSDVGAFDMVAQTQIWRETLGYTPADMVVVEQGNVTRYLIGGSILALFEEQGSLTGLSAQDQSFSLHANASYDGQLHVSDIGQNAQFFVLQSPAHGKVTFIDRSTGEFTYTASGMYVGQDSFSFIAVENGVESSVGIATVTLTNAIPVSSDQTLNMHWRGLSTAGITAQDADADLLEFVITAMPSRGVLTLTDKNAGSIAYQPEGNSLEPVIFSFTVSDGLSTSGVFTTTINFTNTAPVAESTIVSTFYTTKISSRVAASDANEDTLTYEVMEKPETGVFDFDSKLGLFEYSPVGENTYQTSFTYRVFDGVEYSEIQKVTIDVTGKAQQSESSSSGGSTTMWTLLFLLALASCRRGKVTN